MVKPIFLLKDLRYRPGDHPEEVGRMEEIESHVESFRRFETHSRNCNLINCTIHRFFFLLSQPYYLTNVILPMHVQERIKLTYFFIILGRKSCTGVKFHLLLNQEQY